MNIIKLSQLAAITPILAKKNILEDETYEYCRIVSLSNLKYEDIVENCLYFITYAKEEELTNGWYPSGLDLRPHLENIVKEHKNCTMVVEEKDIDRIKDLDGKFIVVEDIHKTIDDMFEHVKNNTHAKVISVTGSVGKTTCVGLIESVLKQKYNVLRIYSKRITPLLLKGYIINFLDDSYDYIVLENSIYYHDHVRVLSNLLEPSIAGILNIESSHIGVDTLDSLDAICKYKSEIFNHPELGFINESDATLSNLRIIDGNLYFKDELILSNFNLKLFGLGLDNIRIVDDKFVINDSLVVSPFYLSNLSKVQYAMAYNIGKYLGLTEEEILKGLKSYVPVENRLQQVTAFGKNIIFDGDITTYERMNELSNNLYEEQYLVLRKVGSNENTYRISNIKEHFKKFKKVFIFDDIEYLDELKDEENVEIVNSHDFMQDLNGQIIYHYSGYYRVWDTYDENNLNIYDREVYKIRTRTE